MSTRKGIFSKEYLNGVISKYKDKFQAAIPPKSDNVYIHIQQELREKFNHNMAIKAIQICIRRNKTHFFYFDDCINLFEEKEDSDPYIITFQMSLAEYSNIVPQNSIYRLLPKKWTNEIQDQIFF